MPDIHRLKMKSILTKPPNKIANMGRRTEITHQHFQKVPCCPLSHRISLLYPPELHIIAFRSRQNKNALVYYSNFVAFPSFNFALYDSAAGKHIAVKVLFILIMKSTFARHQFFELIEKIRLKHIYCLSITILRANDDCGHTRLRCN